MKKMKYIVVLFILLAVIFSGSFLSGKDFFVKQLTVSKVFADDDEHEDEEEDYYNDEYWDEEDDEYSSSVSNPEDNVEVQTEVRTITLLDSDGDGILDKDDPHPDVAEIYIVKDENKNGIVDKYEQVKWK